MKKIKLTSYEFEQIFDATLSDSVLFLAKSKTRLNEDQEYDLFKSLIDMHKRAFEELNNDTNIDIENKKIAMELLANLLQTSYKFYEYMKKISCLKFDKKTIQIHFDKKTLNKNILVEMLNNSDLTKEEILQFS